MLFMFSSFFDVLINIHKYANEIWQPSFNENQHSSKRETHLLPIDGSVSLYHNYNSRFEGISILSVFATRHWTIAMETVVIIHWLDISTQKSGHSVETSSEMFSNHNLLIQYEWVCPFGQFKCILQVRFLNIFLHFFMFSLIFISMQLR